MMKAPATADVHCVAERLEFDEDKGRFEAKLGKIAKAKSKANGVVR